MGVHLLSTRLWGADPADVAWLPQGAREPRAVGTGCVDKDERLAWRPQLPEKRIARTLPGPKRAEGEHRCALGVGDRGDGHGRFRHIHADGERARL